MTIIITVSPPARSGAGSRTDYVACLDGRELCRSRTPFFTSARVLLEEGVSSETTLAMRWDGSEAVTLRSTVGTAAGLTVREDATGGPTLRSHRPFPSDLGHDAARCDPPAAVPTSPAPHLAAA